MNKFAYFNAAGDPLYTASYSDEGDIPEAPTGLVGLPAPASIPDAVLLAEYCLQGGELYRRGHAPSPHHQWDASASEWTLRAGAVDAAKEARCKAVDALRDEKHASPITVDGVAFDADVQSIENIRGIIARIERGDGLTTGWLGWRVFDNTMVWADWTAPQVLQGLYDVARALEDRKQSLLAAAWAHKAAIQGLETLDEVQAYDVTAGWPS